jgi:hypothetical protein
MSKGNNPLHRLANVTNQYVMFYGYVKGRKSIGDQTSLMKMAKQFMADYELEEFIEDIDMVNGYNRICKIMISILKNR